jgi:outer membrane protein TolC
MISYQKIKIKHKHYRCLCLLLNIFLLQPLLAADAEQTLSLNESIRISLLNDPWLAGNEFTQDSIAAMSVAAGSLADPKISVSMANFPTDTFNFGQEAMTQFKVGVSQMLPRGDSLKIKRKQLQIKSESYPYQRQNRKAQITVSVSQLWLDVYKAQMSIALIEKDRQLFEQLSEVAESSYANALGRTRQQDIIRAQLELTRLDDRLTTLKLMQESTFEKLYRWIGSDFANNYPDLDILANNYQKVDSSLPEIGLTNPDLYQRQYNNNDLYQLMKNHPLILALKKNIDSTEMGIDLAKQKYKPAFGINASYGFRGTAPNGNNRPDFLSLGVTFDLPLFTKNRQDQELKAAVAKTQAVKTEEWTLLRKMLSAFASAKAQLLRLNERQALYQNNLIPQMHEQAEASLSAYTNDDGDFAEVVRARIAVLNAEIDALSIDVDRQKTIAQLNYFFVDSGEEQ